MTVLIIRELVKKLVLIGQSVYRKNENRKTSSVGASCFYKKCDEVKDVRRAIWMLR